MAVEGIRITVTDDQVLATLDRIDRAAAGPGEIMAAIAGYLVQSTQRHFETETGPAGRWPALSPRTANRRIGRSRRRGTANILRVTNRLYSSITGDSTEKEATVGTNVIYAAIHQLGGEVKKAARVQDIHLSMAKGRKRFVKASAKRKRSMTVQVGAHTIRIPARPFLYLDSKDFAEIERIVADGFRREADLP
ncbi:MAG: phage virion morphogenesis protein [Rhizobiaceae bacterium]|nr:phage virion morphogenesis protein [Rhizobiaceae bacterium]